MQVTIVTRVDHINRFFQCQQQVSAKECIAKLDDLLIAASNNICQELYNHGCTCMFCTKPHDGMINCARLVRQTEDDLIFIKNVPIVSCQFCAMKIPHAFYLHNCLHGYTHSFSTWISPFHTRSTSKHSDIYPQQHSKHSENYPQKHSDTQTTKTPLNL